MRYLSKTDTSYFRPMLMGGVFLLIIAALMASAYTAEAELPPRPEVTPVASTPLQGGQIQLVVDNGTAGQWTEIQWHDVQNDIWYTVDGWKGHVTLESDGTTGTQTWWVGRKQLNTGPYRWVIYDMEGGELVAVTDSFDTPVSDETATVVMIDLGETDEE